MESRRGKGKDFHTENTARLRARYGTPLVEMIQRSIKGLHDVAYDVV